MANTKSTTQKKSVPAKEVTRKLLDANYKNVAAMRAAGWTDEDMATLVTAPRTRAASCDDPNGSIVWPMVDGHVLLYTFWSREEKDLYNPWYKAHHPKTTSGGTSAKAKAEEQKPLWDELLEITGRLKNPRGHEIALELKIMNMPKPKNGPLQKLFGIDDISQLNTKVTLAWIMYRGPNGERGEDAEHFSKMDAFEKDFDCYLKRDEVLKLVNDLEAKGTKVRDSIIGL